MLNDLRISDNHISKALEEAQEHVHHLTTKSLDRIRRGELYNTNQEEELQEFLKMVSELNRESRKLHKKESHKQSKHIKQETELAKLHLENESLRDHMNVLEKLASFDAPYDEFSFNLEWVKILKPDHKEYFNLLQHREQIIELVKLTRERRQQYQRLRELEKESSRLNAKIDEKYPRLEEKSSAAVPNIDTILEVANSHEFDHISQFSESPVVHAATLDGAKDHLIKSKAKPPHIDERPKAVPVSASVTPIKPNAATLLPMQKRFTTVDIPVAQFYELASKPARSAQGVSTTRRRRTNMRRLSPMQENSRRYFNVHDNSIANDSMSRDNSSLN